MYQVILSGLVDVDAITLSMAKLSRQDGTIEMAIAARGIVLAVVSNTVVKGSIVPFDRIRRLTQSNYPRAHSDHLVRHHQHISADLAPEQEGFSGFGTCHINATS